LKGFLNSSTKHYFRLFLPAWRRCQLISNILLIFCLVYTPAVGDAPKLI
jgi:hypothetical protein